MAGSTWSTYPGSGTAANREGAGDPNSARFAILAESQCDTRFQTVDGQGAAQRESTGGSN